MKLPFAQTIPPRELRQLVPTVIPKLGNSSVAAMYRAARLGGDFYDFVVVGQRVVFVLLDIAGRREEAFDIATTVQQHWRESVPELFREPAINEPEVLSRLTVDLNRTIISAAGGVRCAPAFVGCYDETYATLAYINAGHIPALLKDQDGVSLLEPVGPPLGLFSHSTYNAQITVLQGGAALVLVSRGLVESKAGSHEYGADRVREFLLSRDFQTAQEICSGILGSVQLFLEQHRGLFRQVTADNDITTLALVRTAAKAAAAALS